MAALNVNSYYQERQVTTVSRGQLLVLAYDGMIRFLGEAKRAMQGKEYEKQNTCIIKTQALLMELLNTLDHNAFPQLAENLERLYRYLYDRLTHANVHDDEQALQEVVLRLSELREAWVEADRTVTQAAGMVPA